ncbi:ATP-binding protein [Planctomyces sp. SH-PL14]|jgi:serine/threonine-protein kinase RsbW|uniref:ATP-binding protein n=1 Tax=Planctomyces sp. SH-PL14 TaxID=1632864 RepID=UPI00078ED3E1|nr:ATP-binding protein [Planctomyces sp. SH-PL14]AMV19512.1 Serine/threonine-protein kinase BtrW [Planctomyces sp. SH-PL14]
MSAAAQSAVTIPNDTSAGLEVQERIVGLLEERGYPMKDVFSVRLALEEALINAIKHGNQMDPNKSVEISWEVTDSTVRVSIEDQGRGFDPSTLPDPTLEENLERSSGRGVMLIHHYMTSVGYNDRGNRITMIKERSE